MLTCIDKVDTLATIALIRDISIIVAAAIFSLVLLGIGFVILKVYLQLYPSVLRTARNVEQSSSIVLAVVSQPLSLLSALLEAGNRVWGLIESIRTKDRRNEEDGQE